MKVESNEHLFCECSYVADVRTIVYKFLKFPIPHLSLQQHISYIVKQSAKKTPKACKRCCSRVMRNVVFLLVCLKPEGFLGSVDS